MMRFGNICHVYKRFDLFQTVARYIPEASFALTVCSCEIPPRISWRRARLNTSRSLRATTATKEILSPWTYSAITKVMSPPVMSRSKYEEELSKALYGNVDDLVLKSVDQEYVNWAHADNASADYLAVFTGAVGDQRFSCPTDHVIRTHTQSGDTVFQYFMTHSPTT